MNNIASCLIFWLNEKRSHSQSYSKNHKMPEIYTLVYNCGGQNKNNLMIRFLNVINDGGFFGAATFHFYIKGHTNNDCDHAFKILKLIYPKQNVFTFERCCEILNTINNVEIIQIFHEDFLDLESFLNGFYKRPDPKTININHVLQVKKESAHIGYSQELHGEA